MKLNLYILSDELKGFESYVFCETENSLVFDHFERYCGQEIKDDCIYLAESSKLTAELILSGKGTWLCFGELKNSILQYRKCSIMMLPRTSLTEHFCTNLTEIFLKYHNWNERVLLLGMMNDGIRQLFNSGLLEEVFENPILMQNGMGLFGIMCGTLPDDFDSTHWISLIERKSEPEAYGTPNFEEIRIRNTVKEPFLSEKTERYSFLSTNVFSSGGFAGRLTHCDSNRPFTKGYCSIAAYFNSIFELIVQRNIENELVGDGDSNVFIELLSSWHTDKDWLEQQLNSIQWRPGTVAYMVIASFKGGAGEFDDHVARMVEERMSSLFNGDYVFVYKAQVIAIVRDEKTPYDIKRLRKVLTDSFRGAEITLAVSLTFYDVIYIKSIYRQCQFLLSDRSMESAGSIRFYEDNFFAHFVSNYGIEHNSHWLLHPKVLLLSLYDKKNKSNLVECLLVFIECGFSKKEAASRLSIHYNTMCYRLGRIKDISGIRTESLGNELFHILLSCKLITLAE